MRRRATATVVALDNGVGEWGTGDGGTPVRRWVVGSDCFPAFGQSLCKPQFPCLQTGIIVPALQALLMRKVRSSTAGLRHSGPGTHEVLQKDKFHYVTAVRGTHHGSQHKPSDGVR